MTFHQGRRCWGWAGSPCGPGWSLPRWALSPSSSQLRTGECRTGVEVATIAPVPGRRTLRAAPPDRRSGPPARGALPRLALAVVHRPLGDWLARVFSTRRHWRIERLVYRAVGVDADTEQRWPTYLRSVLAFSLVSVLGLYLLQRVQHWLPLGNGLPAVAPSSAWDTAVSFVTNTNWQGYAGESTM